jgi:hypothetical protein
VPSAPGEFGLEPLPAEAAATAAAAPTAPGYGADAEVIQARRRLEAGARKPLGEGVALGTAWYEQREVWRRRHGHGHQREEDL